MLSHIVCDYLEPGFMLINTMIDLIYGASQIMYTDERQDEDEASARHI